MAETTEIEGKNSTSVFLVLRWHELFDQFTPDTFQPKLLTIPCLVEEAVLVSSLLGESKLWGKHLVIIQEELRDRLESGVEKGLLTAKDSNLLSKIATTDKLSDVYHLGRVVLLDGLSSNFEAAVRKALQELVGNEASNEKSLMDDLLSLVGSQAYRRGCDSDDYNDFETMMSKSSTEVVEWIFSRIPSQEEEFDCIVAVSFEGEEEQSKIRSVLHHRDIKTASPKIPGLPQDENTLFLRKSVPAFKDSQALHELRIEVQHSLNLLGFYEQTRSPRVRDTGWVYVDKKAMEVSSAPRRFDNFHPRRNALHLAGKATKAISLDRGEAALISALDLHGQALRAEEDSIRLVNLWSATECLASLVEGKSIIGRVSRLICPIVTWRRIDKLVRYLAISIHFWLKENPQIDRSTLPFPLGLNDTVDPERLLTVLAEPENSEGISALLKVASSHPLLVYRIYKGWQFASDPKSMRKRQKRSGEVLRWHLWRIYRARNLLVHRGTQSRFVPQLANHLQHYLSLTLSRIMHGLTFGEEWTSKDSITYWITKAEHVDCTLQKDPNDLEVGDIFPEEVIQPNYPVWCRNPDETKEEQAG